MARAMARRRAVAVAAPAPAVFPAWPFALAFFATLMLVAPVRDAVVSLVLRPVAWGLVVSGPTPRPWVDAVAVPGGGDPVGTREAPAALMIKSGRARVAVAMGGALPPFDPDKTYAGAVARRMYAHGVPAAAVFRTDEGRTTLHELVALRNLAEERGWRSVAIVTEDWHSRRLAASAERAFSGSSVRWGLIVAPVQGFDLDHWWESDVGRRYVIEEWLKLAATVTGLL